MANTTRCTATAVSPRWRSSGDMGRWLRRPGSVNNGFIDFFAAFFAPARRGFGCLKCQRTGKRPRNFGAGTDAEIRPQTCSHVELTATIFVATIISRLSGSEPRMGVGNTNSGLCSAAVEVAIGTGRSSRPERPIVLGKPRQSAPHLSAQQSHGRHLRLLCRKYRVVHMAG